MANEVLKAQTPKVRLENTKTKVIDRPKKTAIEQVYRSAHGASWTVQLRDKTASNAELHSLALQLRFKSKAVSVKQIINDRIERISRTDTEMQSQPGRKDLTLKIFLNAYS